MRSGPRPGRQRPLQYKIKPQTTSHTSHTANQCDLCSAKACAPRFMYFIWGDKPYRRSSYSCSLTRWCHFIYIYLMLQRAVPKARKIGYFSQWIANSQNWEKGVNFRFPRKRTINMDELHVLKFADILFGWLGCSFLCRYTSRIKMILKSYFAMCVCSLCI